MALPRARKSASTAATNAYMAARSRHPGGVNAAMCDGSTRFVTNNINLTTWVAASSMGARIRLFMVLLSLGWGDEFAITLYLPSG